SGGFGRGWDYATHANGKRIYLLTDPNRLAIVLDWMLGLRKGHNTTDVHMEIVNGETGLQLAITIQTQSIRSFSDSAGCADSCGSDCTEGCPILQMAEYGLEERACRKIIKELGGELSVENNGSGSMIVIRHPLIPAFDKKKDVISPMNEIRDLARRGGNNVDLLECEVDGPGVQAENEEALLCDLAERCREVFAEGDIIARGKPKGKCYFALLNRQPEEIAHTISHIEGCWDGTADNERRIHVFLLQRFTPEPGEDSEALLSTLSPVA
ncbi:MAG: hypothetical protein ABIA59_08305, partial [Candidatus Latescibacterota bacterium]